MRLVVTGREGQVVTSLVERSRGRPDIEVIAVGRPELDLARPETIAPAIEAARPDMVVSAAAYTAVDMAEDEPELAMTINGEAPGELARVARRIGVPILHISTDYVFDGRLDRPYLETDAVAPLGAYGSSKLAGERAVMAATSDHLILRTAWVYSPFGRNFVRTMLALAETRDRLTVVDDQYGNPTSALDIAEAILAVVEQWQSPDPRFGVFHFAGTGDTSWCGFAREIMAVRRRMRGRAVEVDAIATAQYPTRAARPANSRLDCRRFSAIFGYLAPPWQESTAKVVRRLMGET